MTRSDAKPYDARAEQEKVAARARDAFDARARYYASLLSGGPFRTFEEFTSSLKPEGAK